MALNIENYSVRCATIVQLGLHDISVSAINCLRLDSISGVQCEPLHPVTIVNMNRQAIVVPFHRDSIFASTISTDITTLYDVTRAESRTCFYYFVRPETIAYINSLADRNSKLLYALPRPYFSYSTTATTKS